MTHTSASGWAGRCSRRAILVLVLAAAVTAVAPAAGETPMPRAAIGSGGGATDVRGVLLGRAFSAKTAIASRDFYGDLNIYLFEQRRGCGTVSVSDAPYLWISIDSGGRALRLGATMRSGTGVRVAATAVSPSRRLAFADRFAISFTRIDPRVGSQWHGKLRTVTKGVPPLTNVVSGSFSARWCGRV